MTLEDFYLTVTIQTVFMSLVALVSLIRFRRRTIATRLLGFLYVEGVIVHILAVTIKYFPLTDILKKYLINLVASTYDFFLVILVSGMYYVSFGKKYKPQILFVVISYCVLALVNLIFFQRNSVASYNHLLASLIIICYAVIYFYRLMVDLPEKNLYRLPMFWFNTAFLFFHATTFFIYAFTDYLVKVLNNNLIVYYSIHNTFSMLESILLLIGLYYDWKIVSSSDYI